MGARRKFSAEYKREAVAMLEAPGGPSNAPGWLARPTAAATLAHQDVRDTSGWNPQPFGSRLHRHRAQYQMGHRYHLCADRRTLAVLMYRPRFSFRARGGLVHECAARLPVGRPSRPHGYLAAAHPHPGHSPFRSGVSVYLDGIPTVPGGPPDDL